MPDDMHTIYGDGTRSVEVFANEVVIRELYTDVDGTQSTRLIGFSHAAFREIVIGWQRLQDQEAEQK